jgi:hypothetical protein
LRHLLIFVGILDSPERALPASTTCAVCVMNRSFHDQNRLRFARRAKRFTGDANLVIQDVSGATRLLP